MQLLIVRHACAEKRDLFGKTGNPDALRPLTQKGRRRMRQGARGLRALVDSLDVLASSPYDRARQTAEILAEAFAVAPVIVPALAPAGDVSEVIAWLGRQQERRVALVGHEPDLGRLAALLLTGAEADFLPLKKGAACCLEFTERPRAGAARLKWLLTSTQLRCIDGTR